MKKLFKNTNNRQHLEGVGIEATKGRRDIELAMQVVDLKAQAHKDAGVSGKSAMRMQSVQMRPCSIEIKN